MVDEGASKEDSYFSINSSENVYVEDFFWMKSTEHLILVTCIKTKTDMVQHIITSTEYYTFQTCLILKRKC